MTTVKANEFYHNMKEVRKYAGQKHHDIGMVFLTGKDDKLYMQTTDKLVMATAVIDTPGITDITANVSSSSVKWLLEILRVSGMGKKSDCRPLELKLDAGWLTVEGAPPISAQPHALTPKSLSKIVRNLVADDVSVTFPAERIGGPKGWNVAVYPGDDTLSPVVTYCNDSPLNVWVYGQCSKIPMGKRNELNTIADALKGEK